MPPERLRKKPEHGRTGTTRCTSRNGTRTRRRLALIRSNRKTDHTKRIQTLQSEADRLVEAIAQGLKSRAVTDRLRQTEAEMARLEAEQMRPTLDPESLLPALPKLYREKVRNLEKVAERNPAKARQAILEVIPEAIVLRPEDGHLVAEFGIVPVQLTGTDAGMYGSGGRI